MESQDNFVNKKLTVKRVLNIYGFFTVVSLILSIYTQPLSVNDNMEIIFDSELMLNNSEIKSFLIFIFISAIIYFFSINYFNYSEE